MSRTDETKRQGDNAAFTLSPSLEGRREDDSASLSQLHVLCRSLEQIEIAVTSGVGSVIADFRDVERYAEAIRIARMADCKIWLAALRIHQPGNIESFAQLEKLEPNGILARNLATIAYFYAKQLPVVADFSLNAVNELAVFELLRQGASRITMAYDLHGQSLGKLLETVPPQFCEVILHGHVPMFHTAHCLFCAELSTGQDSSNCGRPCRKHGVRLRDRLGVEHVLAADADCRNTLYHATAQSAAELVPGIVQNGVRHFRLELLEEDANQTGRLIDIYRELLDGRISGRDAWARLKTVESGGISRGTWAVT